MSMIITDPPSTRAQSCISREERLLSRDDLVYCGQTLAHGTEVMSGHGTWSTGDRLVSSVSGVRIQYSRLFLVNPYKSKYTPKVGDVVVGRIMSVQKARWKVDVNYRMAAILHLNNVNLPGGELRRKGVEDEIAMADHLRAGDLVSAEVQKIQAKGQLQLHTRNLKYGKLGQGILVKIPSTLVKPQKEYMHELFGVAVIIGCNGYVWVAPGLNADEELSYFTSTASELPLETRMIIVRIATCIRFLAKHLFSVYDVSIMATYTASLPFKVDELANPEVPSILVPRITDMIRAEEKRRALAREREEVARKRRFMF